MLELGPPLLKFSILSCETSASMIYAVCFTSLLRIVELLELANANIVTVTVECVFSCQVFLEVQEGGESVPRVTSKYLVCQPKHWDTWRFI